MNAGVIPVTMGGDGNISQPPLVTAVPDPNTYREIMAILSPRIDLPEL